MDYSKLEKLKDYSAYDDIDRSDAWADFKHDFVRMGYAAYLVGHIGVGQLVNLWRLAGISSRNGSQWMGRGTALILCTVVVLGEL